MDALAAAGVVARACHTPSALPAGSEIGKLLIIDGCETGVVNFIFEDGCSLADLTSRCATGAQTHGDFVSCVSHLTSELKSGGLISGKPRHFFRFLLLQRCQFGFQPAQFNFG